MPYFRFQIVIPETMPAPEIVMESLLFTVMGFVKSCDWQSPLAFMFIILGVLALLGRWGIICVIVLTLVLGRVANDLIVMNLQTSETVIGVPLVIYCMGGVFIGLSLLVRFVRFMIA
jgi:hypothetical protein